MTEDEAWQMIEEKQNKENDTKLNVDAWIYANTFVDEKATLLPHLSLVQAVQLGYVAGHKAALAANKK